jgi:phosphoribosylformimino-5-aminoimidazole carboxamide ribonucleotide (ProFAR) isomerase
LQRVQEIEQRIEQHLQGQRKITTPTREELEELAAKLETVWNCADTDVRLKKRIVRTLIHEVVVDVDAEAGELILVLHWKGGVHTELRLPRRRRGQNSKQTSKEIVDAVRTLARIGSDEMIAGALTRNGLLTGRGNRWTKEAVTSLRSHHKIPCYGIDQRQAEGWMNLTEAADCLRVSARTLRLAVERGEIAAEHPLADGPWVFNRSELEK